MYIAGLVRLPVPEDQMDAYRRWADTHGAKIFKDHGCLEIVRTPGGLRPRRQTDPTSAPRQGRRPRRAKRIVFSWQVWPDKESFYAAEAKMHEDPRMDTAGEPPFDASRLILGCFQPIFSMGRD